MTTLLSIDWDFFFDTSDERSEKWALYDWGMSEAHHPDLLNVLWVGRAAGFTHYGIDLPTTSGEESTFWCRFNFSEDCEFFIAESHSKAAANEINEGVSRVINFDAHADCSGYNDSRTNDVAETMRVSCEDWLLAYDMWGADIEVRYPAWKTYAFEIEPKPVIDVERVMYDGEPLSEVIDRVFLCRSGSWVPPWLDEKFKEFVESCPVGSPVVLGDLQLVRDWDFSQVQRENEVKQQLLAMHEEKPSE